MFEAPDECRAGHEKYSDEGPREIHVSLPHVRNFILQALQFTIQRRGLIGKEREVAPKLLIRFFQYLAATRKCFVLIRQYKKLFLCCACRSITSLSAGDYECVDCTGNGAWNVSAESLREYTDQHWQVPRDTGDGTLPKQDADAFD